MKKVLIELYDNDALENIISLELRHYDIIIFLCFKNSDPDPKKRAAIKGVISGHTGIEVVFEEANDKTVDSAFDAFCAIADKYPEDLCVVDITGGDEIFIAALGRFLSERDGVNFSAHKSDVFKGTLTWAMGVKEPEESGDTPPAPFPFSDIIKLYGGAVIRPECMALGRFVEGAETTI